MTDQWVPGPGCTPVPPDGIPPANTWTPADSCAPPSGPSITGGVIITGVPATIGSMVNGQYAWTITLNDGQSPPNFSIDRYSGGALVDHPVFISGVDGSVTFTGAVTLGEDPTEPMQAATKEYVDLHSAGVTEAPVDGQLYGRQDEGWTVVPPPPVLEAPTDGQAYVRQSQAWAPLSASMAGYLPTAGGVMTGGIQMNGSPANRWIVGLTSGSLRWAVSYGDATAESGANAGSNFTIQSFTDAGAPLATPLTINRQFGNIVIPGLSGLPPLTINGPSGSWRAIQSQTNGSPRWQMYLADPSGELGSNAGSNFVLNRYSDAGTIIGSALTINRASGQATFSALPSFPGGAAGNVLSTDGAGALSWIVPGGGGISDAPNDGTAYARKSAGWSNLAHTDITDWTATLAPYALITSVPVAATTLPQASGVAAVGTSTAYARADHVHPITSMGDNRIINGDMRIDQRNNGAAGTASGYTIDRWVYSGSQTGKGTWGRAGLSGIGFPYCLGFTSSSAYASLAADGFSFIQSIEADMVSDFQWGSANAQPVTLSFWAQSSLTGTFSGAVKNFAGTRSYPFSYSISSPATMTRVVVTIPGDIAGTWVQSGNAGALQVVFDLGTGATYRGPANAWAGTNYNGVTGTVSVVATNAATFYVTGVKLEIGNVATPFNRQSLAKSLADCQRYYEVCDVMWIGDATTGNSYYTLVDFAVEKRASPTLVSLTQAGAGNGQFGARSGSPSSGIPTRTAQWGGANTSTGPARGFHDTFSASAEL